MFQISYNTGRLSQTIFNFDTYQCSRYHHESLKMLQIAFWIALCLAHFELGHCNCVIYNVVGPLSLLLCKPPDVHDVELGHCVIHNVSIIVLDSKVSRALC